MSGSVSDTTPEYDAETPRADVADDLRGVIDEALRKSLNGRVRDAENERVRIRWIGAFTNAVAEYRKLVNDIEASEHEERIEELEQRLDQLDQLQ